MMAGERFFFILYMCMVSIKLASLFSHLFSEHATTIFLPHMTTYFLPFVYVRMCFQGIFGVWWKKMQIARLVGFFGDACELRVLKRMCCQREIALGFKFASAFPICLTFDGHA